MFSCIFFLSPFSFCRSLSVVQMQTDWLSWLPIIREKKTGLDGMTLGDDPIRMLCDRGGRLYKGNAKAQTAAGLFVSCVFFSLLELC